MLIASDDKEAKMAKPRVAETDHGITGEFNTRSYDEMMSLMRDICIKFGGRRRT